MTVAVVMHNMEQIKPGKDKCFRRAQREKAQNTLRNLEFSRNCPSNKKA